MKNRLLKRIYELTKPHLKIFILVIFLSFIVNALAAARPILIKTVIDEFMQNKVSSKELIVLGKEFLVSVEIIGIVYIIITILQNVFDFFAMKYAAVAGEKVINSTRTKIFEFVQRTNVKFHDKTSSGKLFVRITSNTEDLTVFFQDVLIVLFQDIFYIVIISIIMLSISVRLTIISYVFVLLATEISWWLQKKVSKRYNEAKTIRTKLNTFLAEAIYGAKTIKIFNMQKKIKKENQKLASNLKNKKSEIGKYSGPIFSSIHFLNIIAIATVLWAIIKKLFGVDIAIGEIYIFVTYINELFEPIGRTIENIESIQEAASSLNKIEDLIEQEEYLEDFEKGKDLKNVKGKVEFKNVWFKYNDDDENWVLKDISFTIEPKETIALVGKTGAGKTTIINLINRFYEIQKGEILIDGVNIKDINLSSLRRHIGNILQDPFIFSGTIKKNIELYNELSDDKINEAVDLALARNFVDSLPNGIYQEILERGENLSVGQKQLIAFARIFALNPDIFILDEATANIDTSTEELIQKSIDKLSKEKTAIFIAHRLATIVNVDKILVLENGEIIEQGTHDELVEAGGYYSKLYKSYYESLR